MLALARPKGGHWSGHDAVTAVARVLVSGACAARACVAAWLADVGGEVLEPGPGDEGVEEGQQHGAVVVGQLGDGGELVAEGVFGGAERPSGGVVDEQVVGADAECFGEAD